MPGQRNQPDFLIVDYIFVVLIVLIVYFISGLLFNKNM